MAAATYDLVVFGSGPAGQKAAIQAAKLGKRVAVLERRSALGGVCVHDGTIPSKTLREAVVHFAGLRQRSYYGAAYQSKERVTMQDLLYRCNLIAGREADVIRAQLARNGIDVLTGVGSFAGPHEIEVQVEDGVRRLHAEFVVLATGSVPTIPPNVPVDGKRVVTSDGVLKLPALPRTLLIVGGGVIGVEYASIFSTVGVEVIIVDKRPRLLEFCDDEIVDALVYQMRDANVTLRLGEEVRALRVSDRGVVCRLASGKHLLADTAMVSAGRAGATAGLNLESAGLETDERGRLRVDEHYRTAVPHIYAVGDLIGFPALASTGMEQGRRAACHAFSSVPAAINTTVPYGIFAIPEISMCGATSAELTAKGIPYDEGIARYREIARGQICGDTTGLLKILFHQRTRAVLGVHVIGTQAAELVHLGQAVMALGGTLDYFVQTVFNYPTLAECYKVAALDGLNKLVAMGDLDDPGKSPTGDALRTTGSLAA